MASKIVSVDADSPCARAGIVAGETLVAIDGAPIRDVLDLKFYSYDSRVTLTVEGTGGARREFLMGNYISMTNLSEEDVQRIIRMHISPINISVQTTNPELRVKMLKNKRAGEALSLLPRFAEAGITMNCQLVVCEGINDGDELRRSLRDLEALFPAVNSISVVPFGKTRHREGLYPLEATTQKGAGNILDIVEPFAAECLEKHGTRLVWCGDELYLKAGRALPDSEYYEDFTQFENGIGMLPLFCEEFRLALPDYAGHTAQPFTIATGKAAGQSIAKLIDEAKIVCDNLHGNVVEIRNDFFGHGVSVAGLITGQDLVAQLRDKDLGARVLISANMLRDGGDVFLDDMTPAEVSAALGVPVVPVEIDGADLLAKIFSE